jgi:hypothetical protein
MCPNNILVREKDGSGRLPWGRREEKRDVVSLGCLFLWFATHPEGSGSLSIKLSGGGGASSTSLTKTVGQPQSPGATINICRKIGEEPVTGCPPDQKKRNKNNPAMDQVRKRSGGRTCLQSIGD